MPLRRGVTLIFGILTLLPPAWFVLVPTYFLPRLGTLGEAGGLQSGEYFTLFNKVFDLSIVVGIVAIALFGTSLFYLFRTDRVPAAKRPFWTAALLVAGIVTMPIFWYSYVWQVPPRRVA